MPGMRDPTGKRPKGRPLDYYLPPDQPQRVLFPQWQPAGVSASNLSVDQAPAKFLSAADMYRQDSTTYGYGYTAQKQQHQYTNPRTQAPRSAQPGRSLATPQPPQPPTSTTPDPRQSHKTNRTHDEVEIKRSPPPTLPTSTSPLPRQDPHAQTDPKALLPLDRTNDAANERPSLERSPSLGSFHPRQRTISQPNKEYRRPTQTPPPLPDLYRVVSPTSRRANYPNPNDPFSVVGPRGYSLKKTNSKSTDGSHKGYIHACVSLNRTDRLRMIKFPYNVIAAVKTAIETSWSRGIQNEREILGAYEIQLRGNPWTGQGDESVPARILMCEILSAIYHHGWELRMSTDISQKAMDKDLLIFREGPLPPPCQFLAISFNDNDRLRIISGSGGASAFNAAPNDVINAIKNVWGDNVQKGQWKAQGVAWEFKLAGNPWWASGEDSIQVRILLLNMLDQLTALGWDFHASLDMTAGPGGATRNAGSDTDCWILKKPR